WEPVICIDRIAGPFLVARSAEWLIRISGMRRPHIWLMKKAELASSTPDGARLPCRTADCQMLTDGRSRANASRSSSNLACGLELLESRCRSACRMAHEHDSFLF